MKFTAHNVLLPDGTRTKNNSEPLLSESNVWKAIAKSIDLFFPQAKTNRSKLRVVDLGCLEGGYAVEFAKMGFEVLGIEARQENVDKCNYVKEKLNLENLSFVVDNVRNLEKYGKFDIVLNYGLLYHLNDPYAFMKTTFSCMTDNSILFLNTHFAPERDARYTLGWLNKFFIAPLQKRTKLFQYTHNYRLSGITQNEGYKGRWYREWSPSLNKGKIEKLLWASYDNEKSFWMTKKALTTSMNDAGFSNVFERFDFTGDIMPDNYTEYFNRTMFIAIKG